MSKLKIETISFIKTFLASFLSLVSVSLTQVTPEQYGQLATNGFWASLVLGAVRTAISLTWQKTLPQSIGGVK